MKRLLFIAVVFTLLACKRTYTITPGSSLTNTLWLYSDQEKEYEIRFLEDGSMAHSHPNDRTPGNDYWSEKRKQLRFCMNDYYSRYKSQYMSDTLIYGEARNVVGKQWKWKLTPLQEK